MTDEPIDDPEAQKERRIEAVENLFPPDLFLGEKARTLADILRNDSRLASQWDEVMAEITEDSGIKIRPFSIAPGEGRSLSDDEFMLESITERGNTIAQWIASAETLLGEYERSRDIGHLSAKYLRGAVIHGERRYPEQSLLFLKIIAKTVRKILHLKIFLDALEAIEKDRAGSGLETIDLATMKEYFVAHPSDYENPFGL
jgi:hypothetical protein